MVTVYLLPLKQGQIALKVVNGTGDLIKDIYIIGLENNGYEILPLDFPETEVLINICADINNEVPFSISIGFDNGGKMDIDLEIIEGRLEFSNFRHLDKEFKQIEKAVLESRKRLACELYSSDEGFISELMDVSDEPEEDLAEGEELSVIVAENTLFMHNEEEANNYINWKVVKSPDSVQNTILSKYD